VTTVRWCEISVDHLTPAQRRKMPRWARRAALSHEGVVYLPGLLAASEMEVFLCAGFDRTSVLFDGTHGYYPADWIAREFPRAAEAADTASRKVRELFASEGTDAGQED
jgi:hypothetical protein